MTARFQGRIMQAAVMREIGKPLTIEQVEVEVAEPGPEEVLVKLTASGVCHSDLHALKGNWEMTLPLVLGQGDVWRLLDAPDRRRHPDELRQEHP